MNELQFSIYSENGQKYNLILEKSYGERLVVTMSPTPGLFRYFHGVIVKYDLKVSDDHPMITKHPRSRI